MIQAPASIELLGDPSEAAGRLRLSATRLARRLRQEADAGLTPSQLSALAVIECHGPLTLGALADHERVAPPSITKVVTRLEVDGLVVRTTDTVDRRVSRVTTSARGAALVAESRRRKTAWLASRIGMLNPDQQRRLADALDVLDALTTDAVPTDAVPTDAVPTDAVPTDAVPTDAVPTDAVPTDAVPTDAVPTDAVPTDAVPTDAVPTDAVPTDAVPTDAVPTDAVPTDAVPTDAVPTDAVPTDAVPTDAVPADAVPAGGRA